MLKVFAPVSVGNLSVGFDSLGLALAPVDGQLVGDQVAIETASTGQSELVVAGSHAHYLPGKPAENIVWQCYLRFIELIAEQRDVSVPLRLTLYKNIPVSSGLGSSAASIVAAFFALNEYFERPFSPPQLLRLMGEMEGRISGGVHYDNVAPCYLGGLQLMLPLDKASDSIQSESPVCQTLPFFEDSWWIMAYPNIEVSTRMAREILPDEFPLQKVVSFGQHLAAFVDACHRQDKTLAFSLVEDQIAEPYRVRLLENFAATKQALLQANALNVGISGSGPTLYAAFETREQAEKGKQICEEIYLNNDDSFCHVCKIDNQGARRID